MNSTSSMPFMPVILGGDITAYSLARSFHEEYGTKVLVISLFKNGLNSYSSFIENRFEPNMEKNDVFVDTLQKIGKEFSDKKLILLACADWYVRMIIENKHILGDNYIIPYIDKDLLDRLVLKDSFYEICEEIDVPYPKTFIYDVKENTPLDLPFGFPVIAKPASSALYHFAEFPGQKKVFKFDDMKSLEEMLANLKTSSYDYKFLIQDFIPGNDVNMRILTCYCDKDSNVRFASFGRTILEDHGPSAIGNPLAIINDVNPEIVECAARLLKHVGYTGFANFDLKYDTRDGSLRFFEINTRLGRSNFYVTGSGFNAVKWIVDDLVYGKELPYVVADNHSLYTVVPKSVLLDYARNEKELIDEINDLYAKKKVSNPIKYKGDRSLIHKAYYHLFSYRQKKKYLMYRED